MLFGSTDANNNQSKGGGLFQKINSRPPKKES